MLSSESSTVQLGFCLSAKYKETHILTLFILTDYPIHIKTIDKYGILHVIFYAVAGQKFL